MVQHRRIRSSFVYLFVQSKLPLKHKDWSVWYEYRTRQISFAYNVISIVFRASYDNIKVVYDTYHFLTIFQLTVTTFMSSNDSYYAK